MSTLAYVGLAALVLAVCAPFLRRDRQTLFLALFGFAALAFALGELNPIYLLLYRLPGFGYFRVPSRYLYLFAFAAALLAGTAIEELSARLATAGGPPRRLFAVRRCAGRCCDRPGLHAAARFLDDRLEDSSVAHRGS